MISKKHLIITSSALLLSLIVYVSLKNGYLDSNKDKNEVPVLENNETIIEDIDEHGETETDGAKHDAQKINQDIKELNTLNIEYSDKSLSDVNGCQLKSVVSGKIYDGDSKLILATTYLSEDYEDICVQMNLSPNYWENYNVSDIAYYKLYKDNVLNVKNTEDIINIGPFADEYLKEIIGKFEIDTNNITKNEDTYVTFASIPTDEPNTLSGKVEITYEDDKIKSVFYNFKTDDNSVQTVGVLDIEYVESPVKVQ